MSTKFVIFGCWNEFCCEESSPMYKVINSISRNESDAKYFFILGDNIYPKKEKVKGEKKKIIDEGQLNGGLTLLKDKLLMSGDSDSKLYLLLGNHDIEEMEQTGCHTTTYEKNFCHSFGGCDRFIFPDNLTMFQEINETTLVIMIDTNIYTDEDRTCYKVITDEDLTKLEDKQRAAIANYLSDKNYQNIIVCGHHPLIGFKNQTAKAGELKKGVQKPDSIKGGVETCNPELYSLFLDVIRPYGNRFFYLCADIHNYQKGIVNIQNDSDQMTIEQHIIGIGGAHSDDDYNGKYVDYKKAHKFLETQPPPSLNDIENFLANQSVDYERPAIINIDGIQLTYELQEHFSDFGYLVGEILPNNQVNFRVVNLGTVSSQTNKTGTGGLRIRKRSQRKRNKRTQKRNKRTQKRNKRSRKNKY